MKRFFATITVVCATITLLGCFSAKPTNQTTAHQPTTIIYKYESSVVSVPETQYSEPVAVPDGYIPTEVVTQVASDTAPVVVPDTVPTAALPQESTTMGKTGEMAFSDDPNNKFIASVSAKYGVNAGNLVALYTVPDNNSNIVLEFDGSTNESGRLIRTDKTLVAIYSIDLALNSKCASKDSQKNEYPYGEMMVMFMTTTKYIMPEFKGQL